MHKTLFFWPHDIREVIKRTKSQLTITTTIKPEKELISVVIESRNRLLGLRFSMDPNVVGLDEDSTEVKVMGAWRAHEILDDIYPYCHRQGITISRTNTQVCHSPDPFYGNIAIRNQLLFLDQPRNYWLNKKYQVFFLIGSRLSPNKQVNKLLPLIQLHIGSIKNGITSKSFSLNEAKQITVSNIEKLAKAVSRAEKED